ncbi:uncharacterized protein BDZ99DRAFT_160831 [Mytilinidion resinicola]|uniref:Uncharacterized protein n=1 Tax=Mytilinidion resinicola TaxID=574789 RepID=A0A6A6Y5A8_9PEZI|nr:uncharacterized protein BDZ99DRAFT_160831 [Mytilinidion resinicola]KAF2803708.1 hypothetical protein BDZ99DRAFT_160831 [Mytilinidion resinicola]
MVPRTSDVANFVRYIDEARLSFIPSMGICSNSISARFVKSINSSLQPRLYTQLNAFRLVKGYDLHADLFYNGNVEEIDAAFRSGVITPYDKDCIGSIMCPWLAARYVCLEVLQYLDS